MSWAKLVGRDSKTDLMTLFSLLIYSRGGVQHRTRNSSFLYRTRLIVSVRTVSGMMVRCEVR